MQYHEWGKGENDETCIHCKQSMGNCDTRLCPPPDNEGPKGGWNDYKGGSGNFGIAMLQWQTLKAQGHNNCQVLNIHSGKLELEVYDA